MNFFTFHLLVTPPLSEHFPLFSAHSLSCLYVVISVPPGNFKEGTHGQRRFPSLLQAAGICRHPLEFFCQMPPPNTPPSEAHLSVSLCTNRLFVVVVVVVVGFNVLISSICSHSDSSHLVGLMRWFVPLLTALFMISSC